MATFSIVSVFEGLIVPQKSESVITPSAETVSTEEGGVLWFGYSQQCGTS